MSWFYGEPINDRPFSHSWNLVEFFCKRCDFNDTVYIVKTEWHDDLTSMDFIKATASVMGYHAKVIHPELNGFRGYDAMNYEFVDVKRANELKKEFGLTVYDDDEDEESLST